MPVAASSPKLVLLDSPNNPTGFSMEPESLARFARLSPCPVVLDEAYIEFGGPSVLDISKRKDFPVTRSFSAPFPKRGDLQESAWAILSPGKASARH
jgi:histidinol-phosphate aminotransferase